MTTVDTEESASLEDNSKNINVKCRRHLFTFVVAQKRPIISTIVKYLQSILPTTASAKVQRTGEPPMPETVCVKHAYRVMIMDQCENDVEVRRAYRRL